ncbi:MAG: hypothetical protein R3360_07640 [Alphaproteobacteria bacterium]|nr:hypothetical protein [Alphaproteobacteria bacterium]
MKTVIVFFYLINGTLVSYTASEYQAFQQSESVPAWVSCDILITDPGFTEGVKADLGEGESMRAACYRTPDLLELGTPLAENLIEKD